MVKSFAGCCETTPSLQDREIAEGKPLRDMEDVSDAAHRTNLIAQKKDDAPEQQIRGALDRPVH